jgi:hypothetical protein
MDQDSEPFEQDLCRRQVTMETFRREKKHLGNLAVT